MFENPTVKLNALRNSRTKIACCSSQSLFAFLYAGSSIQNAREQFVSLIHLSFVNFAHHQTPTNNSLTELGLEIQTAPNPKPFRIKPRGRTNCFPSQRPILSPPKIPTFPHESPCMFVPRSYFVFLFPYEDHRHFTVPHCCISRSLMG